MLKGKRGCLMPTRAERLEGCYRALRAAGYGKPNDPWFRDQMTSARAMTIYTAYGFRSPEEVEEIIEYARRRPGPPGGPDSKE